MLKKSLLITCLFISSTGLSIYADMETDTPYNLDQGLIPVPKCILMPSEMGQNYLPMSNLEERLNTIANKAAENLADAKLSLQRSLKNPELFGWYSGTSIAQATNSNVQSYNTNNPMVEYTESYISANINTKQQLYRYLLNLIDILSKHPKSNQLQMRLADLKAELRQAIQSYIPMD